MFDMDTEASKPKSIISVLGATLELVPGSYFWHFATKGDRIPRETKRGR